jgi:hypothetical protein
VAKPDEQGDDGYQKSRFEYDPEKDHYICPHGQILHRMGVEKQREFANRRACKECGFREKCTKSERGRRITRTDYEEAMEACALRFEENKELYKRRQMIIEHPFGTLKRTLGFTYFLTRGIESVKTENYLHILTYNMKRVLNLFSTQELIGKLEGIQRQRQEGAILPVDYPAILCIILLGTGKLIVGSELCAA